MRDAVVIIVIVMYYLLSPRQCKTHVAMNSVLWTHRAIWCYNDKTPKLQRPCPILVTMSHALTLSPNRIRRCECYYLPSKQDKQIYII